MEQQEPGEPRAPTVKACHEKTKSMCIRFTKSPNPAQFGYAIDQKNPGNVKL